MKPAGVCPARVELPSADSEPVRRFAAGLAAIWPQATASPLSRLGISVSGGPDSTALLLMAAAALPGRVAAATVDHRLRPESASEAAFVAELCSKIGIEHAVLPVRVGSGNLQAEARTARYAALGAWADQRGLAAMATGHHADDQAETLLLRLGRASGVAGLAGVRERGRVPGTGLPLLRPLLGWRRDELGQIVEAAGLRAVADPSNHDDRFDRARLRKAISGADWLDPLALAQSAEHLADADEALAWAAQREWEESVRALPSGLNYRRRAPRAVALRVIARIVRELDGNDSRGGQISKVFKALDSGHPASIGSLIARPQGDDWTFSAAPQRRNT